MFAAHQGLKVVVAYFLKVEGLNSLMELDEVRIVPCVIFRFVKELAKERGWGRAEPPATNRSLVFFFFFTNSTVYPSSFTVIVACTCGL